MQDTGASSDKYEEGATDGVESAACDVVVPNLMLSWANALASGDPDQVVAMYADDAELKGTFRTQPVQGHDNIRTYFEDLYDKAIDGIVTVDFNSVAANSDNSAWVGYYAFSFIDHEGVYRQQDATYEFVADESGKKIQKHQSFIPGLDPDPPEQYEGVDDVDQLDEGDDHINTLEN